MESQKLRVDLQDVMQGRLLTQISLAGVFQGLGHCSLPCLEKGEEYVSPPQASHLLVPGSDMPVAKGSLVPIPLPFLQSSASCSGRDGG